MWAHRLVLSFIAVLYLFSASGAAYAQDDIGIGDNRRQLTLLPSLNTELFNTNKDCTTFLQQFENIFFFDTATKGDVKASAAKAAGLWYQQEDVRDRLHTMAKNAKPQGAPDPTPEQVGEQVQGLISTQDVLACAVVTGRVKFAYVPYFATYVLQLGTVLSGVVSMLFIIIGGYMYTFSGLTDSKEPAKKTIQYAIAGLIVSSFAWIIVELVQIAVTGGF